MYVSSKVVSRVKSLIESRDGLTITEIQRDLRISRICAHNAALVLRERGEVVESKLERRGANGGSISTSVYYAQRRTT